MTQHAIAVERLESIFGAGGVKGRRIALFGLSFKPNTDDLRNAPSLVLIGNLKAKGAVVAAYDPVAMDNARKIIPEGSIDYAYDP